MWKLCFNSCYQTSTSWVRKREPLRVWPRFKLTGSPLPAWALGSEKLWEVWEGSVEWWNIPRESYHLRGKSCQLLSVSRSTDTWVSPLYFLNTDLRGQAWSSIPLPTGISQQGWEDKSYFQIKICHSSQGLGCNGFLLAILPGFYRICNLQNIPCPSFLSPKAHDTLLTQGLNIWVPITFFFIFFFFPKMQNQACQPAFSLFGHELISILLL